MNFIKKKLKNGIGKITNNGFLTILLELLAISILSTVVFFVLRKKLPDTFGIEGLVVSFEIFLGVSISTIVVSLTHWITKSIGSHLEDTIKLNHDAAKLKEIYHRELFIETDNGDSDYDSIKKRFDSSGYSFYRRYRKFKDDLEKEIHHDIPVLSVVDFSSIDDVVVNDDKNTRFHRDDFIEQHYSDLMSAHKSSTIYNAITLRLDDFDVSSNKLTLHTSRSTYFDSLVTNRSMDYEWRPHESLRNRLEPGYKISDLIESKLSNHLGANVIIETTEKNGESKMVLIIRSAKVSIGKRKRGVGVSASLKMHYLMDENEDVSVEGIENAISREIIDELNFKNDTKAFSISFEENALFLYRDLVEGGKPNFLFWTKVNVSSEDLQLQVGKANKKFDKIKKKIGMKKKKSDDSMKQDGDELVILSKMEFMNSIITPNNLFVDMEHHPITLSVAASLQLYKNYFNKQSVH